MAGDLRVYDETDDDAVDWAEGDETPTGDGWVYPCPLCGFATPELVSGGFNGDRVVKSKVWNALIRVYRCRCGAQFQTAEALDRVPIMIPPDFVEGVLGDPERRRVLPPGRYGCQLADGAVLSYMRTPLYGRGRVPGRWWVGSGRSEPLDIGRADDYPKGNGKPNGRSFADVCARPERLADWIGSQEDVDASPEVLADPVARAALPMGEYFFELDDDTTIIYARNRGTSKQGHWLARVRWRHGRDVKGKIGMSDDPAAVDHYRCISFADLPSTPKLKALQDLAAARRLADEREQEQVRMRQALRPTGGLSAPGF